jgi:hypothetical protein
VEQLQQPGAHDAPVRQMPAISNRSRSKSEPFRISKPSPYAASKPYSIPLWTIFVK